MQSKNIETRVRPLKPIPHNKDLSHKATGERSEALIIAKLVDLGYHVLIPDGDNLRCDLLIEDIDGRFWRIQSKTGWTNSRGTCIHFLTANSYAHTRAGKSGKAHRNYQGQIDYFAVYCPDTKGVYLIPIDHINGNNGTLYVGSKGANQQSNLR